jgi:hypothetical protein
MFPSSRSEPKSDFYDYNFMIIMIFHWLENAICGSFEENQRDEARMLDQPAHKWVSIPFTSPVK